MSDVEISARIGASTKDFDSAIAGIGGKIRGLQGKVAGFVKSSSESLNSLKGAMVSAFSIGAISAYLGKLGEFAGEIKDTSEQIGVSSKFLQGWQFAVSQSGGKAENATKSLQRLGRMLGEVQAGTGTAAATFASLGITVQKADGTMKSVEEVMLSIADKMQQTSDATDRSRIAYEIFGKDGLAVLNALTEGAKKLNETIGEAPKMTEEAMKALADLSDQIDATKLTVMLWGATFVNYIVEISQGLGFLIGSMKTLGDVTALVQKVAITGDFQSRIALISKEIGKASAEYTKLATSAESAADRATKATKATQEAVSSAGAGTSRAKPTATAVDTSKPPTTPNQPAPRGTGRSYDEVVAASVAYSHEEERRAAIRARIGDPEDVARRGGMSLESYRAYAEEQAAGMGRMNDAVEASSAANTLSMLAHPSNRYRNMDLPDNRGMDTQQMESALDSMNTILEAIHSNGLRVTPVMGR